jgi:hypothetical protein
MAAFLLGGLVMPFDQLYTSERGELTYKQQ